jgi:hypothetical protein
VSPDNRVAPGVKLAVEQPDSPIPIQNSHASRFAIIGKIPHRAFNAKEIFLKAGAAFTIESDAGLGHEEAKNHSPTPINSEDF